METHVVFDIQGYVKSMTDAGADPRLAEAIAHGQIAYLNSTVATKKDIEELRAATKHDIELLQQSTKTAIAESETKLITALASFQFKIVAWNTGILAAFGSILIAILK